jgi:hypothetical protein
MKTKFQLAVLVSTFIIHTSSFGQGALTPPGAPAPTMKSLAQIEPRTPISSAPFTITQSGSYYLTTNVSVSSGNAITISAGNVTLDLSGFTITGTAAAAAGYGIALGGVTNVSIYNGHISSGVTNTAAGVFGGGGFAYGIAFPGNSPFNVRVKSMSVAGVFYNGIYLNTDNSSVVEDCTVTEAGAYGILADSVADSTAMNCGGFGIIAGSAQNCKGTTLGSGYGLYAVTANNCYGTGSSGTGLYAVTANNCSGTSSSGYGLYAGSVATCCYGYSSIGTGLYAYNASFCTGYRPSGTAIQATMATGCIANSGTNIITYKYNMP